MVQTCTNRRMLLTVGTVQKCAMQEKVVHKESMIS